MKVLVLLLSTILLLLTSQLSYADNNEVELRQTILSNNSLKRKVSRSQLSLLLSQVRELKGKLGSTNPEIIDRLPSALIELGEDDNLCEAQKEAYNTCLSKHSNELTELWNCIGNAFDMDKCLVQNLISKVETVFDDVIDAGSKAMTCLVKAGKNKNKKNDHTTLIGCLLGDVTELLHLSCDIDCVKEILDKANSDTFTNEISVSDILKATSLALKDKGVLPALYTLGAESAFALKRKVIFMFGIDKTIRQAWMKLRGSGAMKQLSMEWYELQLSRETVVSRAVESIGMFLERPIARLCNMLPPISLDLGFALGLEISGGGSLKLGALCDLVLPTIVDDIIGELFDFLISVLKKLIDKLKGVNEIAKDIMHFILTMLEHPVGSTKFQNALGKIENEGIMFFNKWVTGLIEHYMDNPEKTKAKKAKSSLNKILKQLGKYEACKEKKEKNTFECNMKNADQIVITFSLLFNPEFLNAWSSEIIEKKILHSLANHGMNAMRICTARKDDTSTAVCSEKFQKIYEPLKKGEKDQKSVIVQSSKGLHDAKENHTTRFLNVLSMQTAKKVSKYGPVLIVDHDLPGDKDESFHSKCTAELYGGGTKVGEHASSCTEMWVTGKCRGTFDLCGQLTECHSHVGKRDVKCIANEGKKKFIRVFRRTEEEKAKIKKCGKKGEPGKYYGQGKVVGTNDPNDCRNMWVKNGCHGEFDLCGQKVMCGKKKKICSTPTIGDPGEMCKNNIVGTCQTPEVCKVINGETKGGLCNGGTDNACCVPKK